MIVQPLGLGAAFQEIAQPADHIWEQKASGIAILLEAVAAVTRLL